MRLVTPRSEVVVEGDWTWLQPVQSSTRVRHTVGTFLLAVLIFLGMVTAILLPPPASMAATAVLAALAIALFVAIVRSAGSRLALSGLGLYVQNGGRAHQVGWAAVRGVYGAPARGRMRVVIDDGYRPRRTRAAFESAVAHRWLDIAAAEAERRQLRPQPHPDGLGFIATAGA